MSASTDPRPGSAFAGVLNAAWQGVGVVYLLFCLAGLATGIWVDVAIPPKEGARALPLPALGTLAISQAMFFLLVYPLTMFRRCEKRLSSSSDKAGGLCPLSLLMECVGLLLVSVPFYVVAAYVSDAVAADAIRSALCTAAIASFAWAAGAWLCRGGAGRTVAAIVLLAAALGLPAACYIISTMLNAQWATWAWHLAPATFAWENAQPRGASVMPGPLWAWLAWPVVAVTLYLLNLLRPVKIP